MTTTKTTRTIMDNRQDITDDEMDARDNARLVDVEETQDIEVVGAHGATITTLTESGSDYCRHDPSVICGVDGVATEAEWRAALRQILDIRVANPVLDTWSIIEETLGEDELCQRDPASIAAAVRSAVNEKVISEHLADMPYDEYGVDWDENATDSYVQRAYGDYGRARRAVTVRIGLDPTTHFWWVDEGDDAERDHYGPYATRAQAEAKMDECLAKDESAEEVQ